MIIVIDGSAAIKIFHLNFRTATLLKHTSCGFRIRLSFIFIFIFLSINIGISAFPRPSWSMLFFVILFILFPEWLMRFGWNAWLFCQYHLINISRSVGDAAFAYWLSLSLESYSTESRMRNPKQSVFGVWRQYSTRLASFLLFWIPNISVIWFNVWSVNIQHCIHIYVLLVVELWSLTYNMIIPKFQLSNTLECSYFLRCIQNGYFLLWFKLLIKFPSHVWFKFASWLIPPRWRKRNIVL